MVELILTVGVPASGKSTWSREYAEKNGYAWVSSDNIRKDFDYDISNADVFEKMYWITKDNLKKGIGVIYDATNLSMKRRRTLINNLKSSKIDDAIFFHCEIFLAPMYELKERNSHRSGADCVPEEVIDRMIRQFQFPQYFEGWDLIHINEGSTGHWNNLYGMKGFDQCNPHHTLDLYEHSRAVMEEAKKLGLSDDLCLAAMYHDLGKLYTQTFDEKGIAHYYNHDNVSAYLFALEVVNSHNLQKRAWLAMIFVINYHMRPMSWTKKSYEKDKELFGEVYTRWLEQFNYCDKKAH